MQNSSLGVGKKGGELLSTIGTFVAGNYKIRGEGGRGGRRGESWVGTDKYNFQHMINFVSNVVADL